MASASNHEAHDSQVFEELLDDKVQAALAELAAEGQRLKLGE